MSRLLLVRHGISEYNSARRFAGYSDVEMNTAGHEQVERLRDRLVGEKIGAVYCSDLRRASVTAEIICSRHEVDMVTCSELREVNYGNIEGLTFDEIGRLYPDVAELIRDFSPRLKFPGGESFAKFIERTITFLGRLEKHEPSETILIVAHSGSLRVLVCYLLGIDQSHWRQLRLDNASLSIMETYPQRVIISLLNDTSHLRE